ncbi:MAG: hypothetical protein CVU15_05560 [Betaproteobacteria bacterium HGW-Betaproteobacteria-1]|jgi:Flp pilus assembly protein TadD|nr:MAG: hypothetical protein CVU15_05560 [Betaproteobacteria bacterium HGW-Betaproteobacteria-1]
MKYLRFNLRIWFGMLGLACLLASQLLAAAEMMSNQQGRQPAKARNAACAELPAEDATNLGLIRQTLADGKPHAALAFLDASGIAHPQAEVLRADGLRQSGREGQAEQIYRQLLSTCVSGYAYRGLGLIAANAGNIQEAVEHLRMASAALPTEHTIRNDYGYMLMLADKGNAALHEFLTAVELVADYRQAAHNLLLLLYRNGDDQRAQVFARQFGVTAEEMTHLQEMARQPLSHANINQERTGVQ